MRAPLFGVVLLLAAVSPGQAPANAAQVTEPGRTLARPLDMFFGGTGRGEAPERSVILLLDATASVAASGFADALEQALQANAAALQRTGIGLGVVGAPGTVVLPPGPDHGRFLQEVRGRLQRPGGEFQNVYADLRAAAAALARTDGEREILLVTLENGDVEDDLEQTVAILEKARAKLTVLTTEAYVADSYWAARPYQEKPRGTTLTGGDAPVIDLPWGWLFQITVANEVTPAAYATYGLNRLVAATGGRLFLHTKPDQTGHQCGWYNACLFCRNDHLPQEEAYWDTRVRLLAPLTLARKDALSVLGRDPCFRAVVTAWRQAAQEGLLRSQPPVRLQGTSASPDRQRPGRDIDLLGTTSFARHARRAEEAAAAAERLRDQLAAELERIGQGQALPRQEASAHFTLLMLQLARVNLITFAGWCRDVAPVLVSKDPPVPLPPELPILGPDDQRAVGIGYTNLSLCHGVLPFREVELPGGAALRVELDRLEAMRATFLQRFGHTQYAFGLHRSGIARFHLTYPGIVGKVPRPRPKSDSDTTPPLTPTRPTRSGPGATTGPSGPTTGGR